MKSVALAWGATMLWILWCLPPSHALGSPLPAISDPGHATVGLWNGPVVGASTVGWEFAPQCDIWVSQLGFYDSLHDGLNTSHSVGLWDASGQLLASAWVSDGTDAPLVGEYRYADIVPVLLGAGQTFFVGATVPESSRKPPAFFPDEYPCIALDIALDGLTADPLIQLLAADRYVSDMDGPLDDPAVFPGDRLLPMPVYDGAGGEQSGTWYPSMTAASFQFTPVPEPSALMLVVLGAGAAIRLRLRAPRPVP